MATTIATTSPTDQLPPYPDLTLIVTEDDTPEESYLQGIQQRLLVESLYASWPGPGDGRPFLAASNVGLFYRYGSPPLVPDTMVSFDVTLETEFHLKENRSYFTWLVGKPPDVAIEIVSNTEGNEDGSKLLDYARIGVPFYAIYDPRLLIGPDMLRIYERNGHSYRQIPGPLLDDLGLGLQLWTGTYENLETTWLRWSDAQGNLILNGAERAAQAGRQLTRQTQRAEDEKQRAEVEKPRAEVEKPRAEVEKQRAEDETRRAELFAAKLRELGVDPNSVK